MALSPHLLPVEPLASLRSRRSAKWQTYPPDVIPLTVAEMDFALAPSVAEALHDAVERSDAGYAMPVPDLGQAVAEFAGRRWGWQIDAAWCRLRRRQRGFSQQGLEPGGPQMRCHRRRFSTVRGMAGSLIQDPDGLRP